MTKAIRASVALGAALLCVGGLWRPEDVRAAEGTYTEAQAGRGATLYAEHCAPCHGTDLRGTDYGPGVAGRELLSRWRNRSLGELLTLIQSTMPVNNPGGLRAAQNADILAFMLQRASVPSGSTELSNRIEALNAVKVNGLTPAVEQK